MPKFKPKEKPETVVLGYLLHRGSISRHRASTHFDIWDLPQVIHKLRKRGYRFTRKGKSKDLTYSIVKEDDSCPIIQLSDQ